MGHSSPSISHLFFVDDSLLFFRENGSEASVIRELLLWYEKASGQTINYEISVVAFSPNTEEGAQQYISQILSVSLCPCHQQYLGLPSFMPRNRSGTLRFLKDRIWRQIQGWKGKFFSIAGKEVLLKSIVQAIPCYTMNCFRLPKGLVKEIHRAMAKFWWRGSEDTRRIHWMSWESLCLPKCMGGLGFRDMELFNQALLAKQCWRILQEPSSLLFSVLRGRYFPQSGFLEAGLGLRPSFVWRSLLSGRELLVRGCRWRIGNGRSTPVYGSNWLPNEFCLQIQSVPSLPAASVVSDLFAASGGWDEAVLRAHFDLSDREAILRIPLRHGLGEDRLIWHFEKHGAFIVKSGYRLAQTLAVMDRPSPSNPDRMHAWWSGLWRLNVPGKHKFFLWRLFHDRLPTKINLLKRDLNVPSVCVLCDEDVEDRRHLF